MVCFVCLCAVCWIVVLWVFVMFWVLYVREGAVKLRGGGLVEWFVVSGVFCVCVVGVWLGVCLCVCFDMAFMLLIYLRRCSSC